jgi:hypothetical protein
MEGIKIDKEKIDVVIAYKLLECLYRKGLIKPEDYKKIEESRIANAQYLDANRIFRAGGGSIDQPNGNADGRKFR